MLFILDAYNIIGRLKKGRSWQDVRRGFLRFLHRHPVTFSKKNRIIVVFDGQRNPDIILEFPSFEVVFSGEETADKRIDRILSRLRPSSGVVVSDDREVKFYAKKAGIRPVGVDEFISWMSQERGQELDDEKDLRGEEIAEINEELYRLWVKKGS